MSLANLAQDFKYGLRILAKNPGFALIALLVLALGIGANTAIFSVVDTVLLRPLPYRQSSRLMYVWHVPPAKSFPGQTTFAVSPANYLDWKAQNHVFENMAIVGFASLNLTGRGEPQAVKAAQVSPDFFSVLGVKPQLGRVFLPQEDQPGHGRVVVLSYSFWKDQLGGDPKIVGRSVTFNGQSYTVAGVMPPRFTFPDFNKVWVPTAWTDEERAVRGVHDYVVVARLKPGVGLEQARAEMNTISGRLQQQYPTDDSGWGATVVPMHEQDVHDVRLALLVLLGAVGFVLLIACANVANLMLAKTLARRKEIAIRTALGASRRRILQQVLAEAVILAVAGGALGLNYPRL